MLNFSDLKKIDENISKKETIQSYNHGHGNSQSGGEGLDKSWHANYP